MTRKGKTAALKSPTNEMPEPAASERGVRLAEGDHVFEETKDVVVLAEEVPVEPRRFIILIVGIIVALLRIHEFIPSAKHGSAVGEKQEAAKVLHLTFPQVRDLYHSAI